MKTKWLTLGILIAIGAIGYNLIQSKRGESPELSALVLTQETQTPVTFKGRGENRLYASGTINDLIDDLVSPPVATPVDGRKAPATPVLHLTAR